MKCPSEPERPKVVTTTSMMERVKHVDYLRVPDTTTTMCFLHLRCGFLVVGKSACVDPARFNQALGEKYAYEDAINKMWELEGYRVSNAIYEGKFDDDFR